MRRCEASPTLSGLGFDDRMAGERTGKALWRSVVKEDEHRQARVPGPVRKR